MWGINHEIIANLLTDRQSEIRGIIHTITPVAGLLAPMPQYTRTLCAVRGRLKRIGDLPGLKFNPTTWNGEKVHQYFLEQQMDPQLVQKLLNLTEGEINMIVQVCPVLMSL